MYLLKEDLKAQRERIKTVILTFSILYTISRKWLYFMVSGSTGRTLEQLSNVKDFFFFIVNVFVRESEDCCV